MTCPGLRSESAMDAKRIPCATGRMLLLIAAFLVFAVSASKNAWAAPSSTTGPALDAALVRSGAQHSEAMCSRSFGSAEARAITCGVVSVEALDAQRRHATPVVLASLFSYGASPKAIPQNDHQVSSTDPIGVADAFYVRSESGKATRGAGGVTKLFRAVSEGEFKQLMSTGKFAAGPNSLGGKFFAETAEHAGKWGEAMMGKGNFRIIEAELPTSAADQLMRFERLDGIGPARYGELDQLIAAVVRAFK